MRGPSRGTTAQPRPILTHPRGEGKRPALLPGTCLTTFTAPRRPVTVGPPNRRAATKSIVVPITLPRGGVAYGPAAMGGRPDHHADAPGRAALAADAPGVGPPGGVQDVVVRPPAVRARDHAPRHAGRWVVTEHGREPPAHPQVLGAGRPAPDRADRIIARLEAAARPRDAAPATTEWGGKRMVRRRRRRERRHRSGDPGRSPESPSADHGPGEANDSPGSLTYSHPIVEHKGLAPSLPVVSLNIFPGMRRVLRKRRALMIILA